MTNKSDIPSESNEDLFHGAAIIAPDGNEIPITDDMIEDVLKVLIQPDHTGH